MKTSKEAFFLPFESFGHCEAGLPDDIFSYQNPNLAKFGRDLQWKMLVYFAAIWYILRQFGIFCVHLVYFIVIWHTFPCFGMLRKEKSGNPAVRPLDDPH
jgi:hypothetical protein